MVFFVVQERYHENFVIYDKDLCKHWKNGFFCDKIDRKSVLWTHTSQTVTGKREREKVEFMSLAVVTLKKGEGRFLKSGGLWVYDNEIASIMGSFVNGDIVLVRDLTDIRWEEDLSTPIPRSQSVCLPEMSVQRSVRNF